MKLQITTYNSEYTYFTNIDSGVCSRKQPIHVACLWAFAFTAEQHMYRFIIAEPDGVFLLNTISSNAPNCLDNFFLRQPHLFADIPVTELIIRSVNIIPRCDYQIERLLVSHLFHNLRVIYAFVLCENTDTHHQ